MDRSGSHDKSGPGKSGPGKAAPAQHINSTAARSRLESRSWSVSSVESEQSSLKFVYRRIKKKNMAAMADFECQTLSPARLPGDQNQSTYSSQLPTPRITRSRGQLILIASHFVTLVLY